MFGFTKKIIDKTVTMKEALEIYENYELISDGNYHIFATDAVVIIRTFKTGFFFKKEEKKVVFGDEDHKVVDPIWLKRIYTDKEIHLKDRIILKDVIKKINAKLKKENEKKLAEQKKEKEKKERKERALTNARNEFQDVMEKVTEEVKKQILAKHNLEAF